MTSLSSLLRVNHAGEYGAQRIYQGQLAVLGKTAIAPVLEEMAAQEKEHLEAFETLLVKHAVRPTLLHPVWHVAGFALGAITALMGEKAAMACTIAVEEVIDEHYSEQITDLEKTDPTTPLLETLRKFRADELGHKATAEEHHGKEATGYLFLRHIIRNASKTAIFVSKRL